ncbi:methylated-DNA--[protein]-cysteine S-methyltransferase [Catalinimonas sp. 4WD22]|uniref:bifunctional transcriptional activator/DNA repair enzyme AdaA n=1 Tax=Catalinimonas locisalis TaxID=3133978 RepID=UPI003100BF56
MELTFNQMYNAILEKDSQYEGVFFTAVKTTGIFCRPICSARKPKPENVEFFKTSKECILKGYRACMVCKPLENLNQTPADIKNILNLLEANPLGRIKDYDLKRMGASPSQIRRWFLNNHGITFHSYQRMLRLNTAFKKIQKGANVTEVAFDSGYDSLSGFGSSFKNIFGAAPNHSRTQQIIDVKRIESPLGTMYACATGKGICLLEFTDRRMLENEFKDLTKKLNAVIVQGENPLFELLEKQLKEYFNGNRKEFTVPLHTPGSAFQQLVWNALRKIPYGTTQTYKEQSMNIQKPNAVRAVANANGMNRISILIPCHRVIGTDGSMTGYGGGIWRKKRLLEVEKEYASIK